MSFQFVRAVHENALHTLDYVNDTFLLHLIGPVSGWDPTQANAEQEDSLATVLADEIGVGGYAPVGVALTIVRIGKRTDIRLPTPVVFPSVNSGVTIYAAVLGRATGDMPIAWFDASTPAATTGGNVEAVFANADLNYAVP